MTRPVVTVDPASTKYKTLDEAGQALCSSIATPRSKLISGTEGHEQGGAIFQAPDGSYQISSTVPGQHNTISFAANVPKGYKLAGIAHSHPTMSDDGQVFSGMDVNVAKQLGVPSYVQFDASGQCRKYVPGKTKTYLADRIDGGSGFDSVAHGDPLTLPASPAPAAASTQTVPTNNTQPFLTSSK